MILNKITTIEARTSDGKKMVEGLCYVMLITDRTLCGIYRGIGERKGSLMFDVPIENSTIRFNIMPGSINEIYEAEIALKRDFNLPEVENDN